MVINKDIPFKIKLENYLQKVKLSKDHKKINQIKKWINKVNKIGHPKAVYRESYIDKIEKDYVVIEGQKFKSKVLSINLQDIYKVIIYVITCGRELMEWVENIQGDILENYWLSMLQDSVLNQARDYVMEEINNNYFPGSTSTMNPGSTKGWSISEQTKLFKLLGELEREIGVSLTESFLMIPQKSVSGLVFPTEENFENCQLCSRKNCPRRKTPFEPELLAKKYN